MLGSGDVPRGGGGQGSTRTSTSIGQDAVLLDFKFVQVREKHVIRSRRKNMHAEYLPCTCYLCTCTEGVWCRKWAVHRSTASHCAVQYAVYAG